MKTIFRSQAFLSFCFVLVVSSAAIAQFGVPINQKIDKPKMEPAPENIKAVEQPDSPVQVTIEGIYPSPGTYKTFGYTLRNLETKEITSLIIRNDRGGVIDAFYLGLPQHFAGQQLGFEVGLKGGVAKTLSHPVMGYDGKSDASSLSIDFVLFRDGTSWGPDLRRDSPNLLGIFDGQQRFVTDVKKLVAEKDDEGLRALIMRDGPPPELVGIELRSRHQLGFGGGYNVARLMLRSDLLGRGDLTGVSARIRDIEGGLGLAPLTDDKRKQFSIEYGFNAPLRFVGFVRGNQNMSFDDRFSADGDWLTGTRLKLRNESGKVIKSVSLGIYFPETINTGPGMTSSLRYGPHPITRVENVRQPRIAAGRSFEIVINEDYPGELMRFLASRQDFNTVSRAIIDINYIDFEDGTRWGGGQWQKPDPENPKRWIPIK